MALVWRLMPGEYFAERARVALRDKQYLESQRFAESGLAYEKRNPDLFYYLGEATRGRSFGEQEPAIVNALRETSAEAFEEGLLLFPQDTRLLLKFGESLDTLHRFKEADSIFQRAITNDPNFSNVYAFYGLHWLAQHHLQEARRDFIKALNLGSNEIAVHGIEQIEWEEKDPLMKVLRELMPVQTNQPSGGAAPPAR